MPSKLGLCIRVISLSVLLTAWTGAASAQEVTARLQGTVTDQTGAVIPEATLAAYNTSTGVVTRVTSDAAGQYIFPSLVAGNYQVTVEKVELTEAQSTGNPMLKWTLRVIAPKFVNRLMWRNSVITHNTLKYVKTDLHLCGRDLEKLSELPKHLKKLLDVKLEVTKKTKGDNENIFFNRRIENDRAPGKFRQEADDALVPF